MKRTASMADVVKPLSECPSQAYLSNAVQVADLLEWILEQNIYNIRLGARKGSMSGESELFERTSHLVLYDVDHPNKQMIFDIESCAEMSGTQLKEAERLYSDSLFLISKGDWTSDNSLTGDIFTVLSSYKIHIPKHG